jgi:copper chaperone NosL
MEIRVKNERSRDPVRFAALLACLALLSACSRTPIQAKEPTRETSCALDGMILLDYPGPKGQIQYTNGETDFFCDTVELLSIYLRPEQQKRVKGIFTQDMGKAKWEDPRDNWIDARTAFYVAGSNLPGSMGPTFASFARAEDAQSFVAQHGGKVLRFNEITPQMVILDGGVIKDETMK